MRTIHLFSVVPRLQCSIQVESLSSSAIATMAMSQDSSFKLKVVGDDGHRHTVVDTHKDPSKGNMFNALSKLDKDGDGAFRVEDLMRVMEDQQQMSQTVRSQRYALVALTVVIILLFGVNLASSVFAFSLMKDMSVQNHVLADRSGNEVLVGSADIQIVDGTMQARNTSTGVKVTNQAMQVDGLKAARRLESTDTTNTKQQLTIPKTKADEVALLFRSGVSTFTVPVPSTSGESEVWTVQVDSLIAGELAGSAGGNKFKWGLDCDKRGGTCDVEVLEGALDGAAGPSRRLAPDSRHLSTWHIGCKKYGC